jgi:hypothetical protein
MIVVRVELWSAINGAKTELARMVIANDGAASSANHRKGDYNVATVRGRSKEALDQALQDRSFNRTGKVVGHNRLREHVWNLVAKALSSTGYGGK